MSKRNKSNQLVGLFNSGLSLFKAIARLTIKFFKYALKYLVIEIFFGSLILGCAYILVSWGISADMSFYLALGTILTICALLIVIGFVVNNTFKHQQPKKVKIKLATWLANTFLDRTSLEWTEYQDWLHDIFLARRQLLETKCPRWKVNIITYWRLSAFFVIVSLARIKNIAVSVMRLR